MNVALAIAALGWFVLAFGHTAIGLRRVLPNLTQDRLPSTPFAPPSMTLSMVRFTWHIVSVLLVAFGILLMALALAPDADPRTLLLRWCAALSLAATAQAWLAGSPPSEPPPAPTGAVGLGGDCGDVLDSIHLSPDPFVSTGRGRRRDVQE
jgi:hypothetical protein